MNENRRESSNIGIEADMVIFSLFLKASSSRIVVIVLSSAFRMNELQ